MGRVDVFVAPWMIEVDDSKGIIGGIGYAQGQSDAPYGPYALLHPETKCSAALMPLDSCKRHEDRGGNESYIRC